MVDIYIETIFEGSFGSGNGKYSIVLAVEIDGKAYTKTHFGAWTSVTPQRLNIYSVIDALGYMRKNELINIHINSHYMAGVYKKSEAFKTNQDLWKQYRAISKGHDIIIINERRNEYSEAMRSQLKHEKIKFKEDKRK